MTQRVSDVYSGLYIKLEKWTTYGTVYVYVNNIDRVEDRVRAPTGDPQSGFGVSTGSPDPYGPMATLIRIWLLGRSFGKTGYVVKGGFLLYIINRYTHRTRVASTSRPPPDRAINTAIITSLYIAIQRYTLYSYTSLTLYNL